jgi:hypothetical protein
MNVVEIVVVAVVCQLVLMGPSMWLLLRAPSRSRVVPLNEVVVIPSVTRLSADSIYIEISQHNLSSDIIERVTQ